MAKALKRIKDLEAGQSSPDTQKHRTAYDQLKQLQALDHAETLAEEVLAAVQT